MMIRKILLGTCIALFSFLGLLAQEGTTLRGTVIDEETKMPLAYCTVLNKSNKVVTISNVNGDFVIAKVNDADSIRISMVGYQMAELSAADLRENETVELSPKAIELDEFVVRNIDFDNYISIVYNAIKENYPASYPTFEGIYRKQLLEDGAYVFLGECEVACRNTKKNENTPKIAVGQAYTTVNKTHDDNRFYVTIKSNLALYPLFYFLNKDDNTNVEWKYVDTKVNEDESSEVDVFSFANRSGVLEEGAVQINVADHAVVRVDRTIYLEDNWIDNIPKGFNITDNKVTTVFKYNKRDDGQYVLNYSRSEWTFSFGKEGDMHRYTLTNDFLVTNYDSKQKRIRKNSSVDPFKIAKDTKVVDFTDLKHLTPDYDLK